jgi:tetratricopeptide (TPR) repeat protein/mono/diheme cytochrome c family protein
VQHSSKSRGTQRRAVTAQWLRIASIAAAGAACGDRVPDSPTFVGDVAPILHAHCARCHRPSGVAPFPLLTWEDARAQAPLIAAATGERRMPPWLPDESDVPFADERRLTSREIAILGRWAEQGAERGSGAPPAPPTYSEDWQLGRPDLVLELPEAYQLATGEGDVFRNFVLPVPLREARHVRAVELQPGNLQVVHHAVVAVDPTATSRQEDAADPEPGFDGMFSRRAARPPPGFFVGWTPGRIARPNPDGLSWLLEPGVDLVLQMHMRPHGHASSTQPHGQAASVQPAGQAASVQPRIGIYFADEPPARTPVLLRLGSQTLDIPPGAAAYAVNDSLHVPIDVELLSLYPHAHYLGRTMDVRVVLPNGRERQLLRIDDWDFNWQDSYMFERPVLLPAGSVIRLHYVYDNSAANPRNPARPPARVVYGPNTTDEMAELWIQAVPRRETELAILQREITRKAMRDHVEGWEHLIRIDPRDAIAHASLGAFHSSAGNPDVAIRHYRSALDAQPDLAPAHYNLAMLLEVRADAEGALHHYREAVRLRPDHAGTHNNLGNLLLGRGNRTDAAVHFRRAIELDPDQAEAHNNLGRLLWDQGRTTEAIAHYRRALETRPQAAAPRFNLALALASAGRSGEALEQFEEGLRLEPNAVEAYVALAWVFATDPDSSARRPQHAIELGTRAARLLGRPHPRVLDVIAAAEAAAGRFDRAAELAAEARRLATDTGDDALASSLDERLNLYRLGRPFRERSRDASANPVR